MSGRIRIGTSGWEYRHWDGAFYPPELPRERRLEFYAERFETVELNNPFYRLPEGEVFARWGERVPGRFRFAVKASRYLTHVKRLRDPEEPLDRFWSRARRLDERLGPVLYQLPPRWKLNVERLAHFLERVPREPQAIEFRDRRWYALPMRPLLEGAAVALCLHDMPGSTPRPLPVGPFVYVRFHGSGSRYGGRYSSQRLTAWADRMAGWAGDGRDVWAYFNNDERAHAVRDAERLREMVQRRIG
ncbi:MAG: DUF72 domain-containing protein [Chloroflexi bacterium]|nr:DUF72 domain-containing protein [Chloroflexota bacterium]